MQTYKISGREPRRNLGDLGFGDDILETTPKVQSMKEKKLITWTSLKLKTSAL